MAERQTGVGHPFAPVRDADCRTLVLGTFPSVASRANAFYYGHPQNRFWRTLAGVYGERVPETILEKRALLLTRGVALWDVLKRCDVTGSADSSLRACEPNDIAGLVKGTQIRRVLLNGQTAAKLYQRYCAEAVGLPALTMPSTSPANAAWSLERLTEAWRRGLLGPSAPPERG